MFSNIDESVYQGHLADRVAVWCFVWVLLEHGRTMDANEQWQIQMVCAKGPLSSDDTKMVVVCALVKL